MTEMFDRVRMASTGLACIRDVISLCWHLIGNVHIT